MLLIPATCPGYQRGTTLNAFRPDVTYGSYPSGCRYRLTRRNSRPAERRVDPLSGRCAEARQRSMSTGQHASRRMTSCQEIKDHASARQARTQNSFPSGSATTTQGGSPPTAPGSPANMTVSLRHAGTSSGMCSRLVLASATSEGCSLPRATIAGRPPRPARATCSAIALPGTASGHGPAAQSTEATRRSHERQCGQVGTLHLLRPGTPAIRWAAMVCGALSSVIRAGSRHRWAPGPRRSSSSRFVRWRRRHTTGRFRPGGGPAHRHLAAERADPLCVEGGRDQRRPDRPPARRSPPGCRGPARPGRVNR